jgi:uncharacterized protein (DUF1499 family)
MNKMLTYTTIATAFSLMTGCAGEIPKNLGVHDGRLAACPSSPNCVSSQADDEQHRIAPLALAGNPEIDLARLKQTLGKREDTKIVEARDGYLRVEFHTRLFVDDGEFLLDPEHRVVQVRSASRLGHSDLGKNRSRMEEIRQALLKE